MNTVNDFGELIEIQKQIPNLAMDYGKTDGQWRDWVEGDTEWVGGLEKTTVRRKRWGSGSLAAWTAKIFLNFWNYVNGFIQWVDGSE